MRVKTKRNDGGTEEDEVRMVMTGLARTTMVSTMSRLAYDGDDGDDDVDGVGDGDGGGGGYYDHDDGGN
eukprot:7147200-Pyramimonas_sp.AAC.1